MARKTVTVCDNCGCYIDHPDDLTIVRFQQAHSEPVKWELCDSCAADVLLAATDKRENDGDRE
jgi:hypothetical protein